MDYPSQNPEKLSREERKIAMLIKSLQQTEVKSKKRKMKETKDIPVYEKPPPIIENKENKKPGRRGRKKKSIFNKN